MINSVGKGKKGSGGGGRLCIPVVVGSSLPVGEVAWGLSDEKG